MADKKLTHDTTCEINPVFYWQTSSQLSVLDHKPSSD
jgi:hypothetical protein